jgi:hypothetical protein
MSKPESVDWALERHGRRKRPWWTQCWLHQSYDDFMVESGLRLFFDFLYKFNVSIETEVAL